MACMLTWKPLVAHAEAIFVSSEELMRRDPDVSGRSEYGFIKALPQLPSAPSGGSQHCQAVRGHATYPQRV